MGPSVVKSARVALAVAFLLGACTIEAAESNPAVEAVPTDARLGGPNTAPDDSTIAVTYGATGGTITSRGLYTAGPRAGTFRITAVAGGIADTAVITLAAPVLPGAPAARVAGGGGGGIPMGMSGLFTAGVERGPFSMSFDGYRADNLVGRLAAARGKKLRLLLNLTGGSHENYKTAGAFDITKWMARMQAYNTAAIQGAIAAGVADGTIIGASVMDEPHNTSPTASWGPEGTMTKARIDEMCRYAKALFPTMPIGVVHDHRVFEPETGYASCDFLLDQYAYRKTKGDVIAFRDGGLAFAARYRMAVIFGMNILDGGVPRKASGTCDLPETGGQGTFGRNCRMTPEQIREFGLVLGPAGCAFSMWRYDREFFANSANQAAFAEIADSLAKRPSKPCTRQ